MKKFNKLIYCFVLIQMNILLSMTGFAQSTGIRFGNQSYASTQRMISGNFTIEFWMKTPQVGESASHWYDGIGLIDAGLPGYRDDFGVSLVGSKLAFGVGTASTFQDVTIFSTSNVNTDSWVHIAVTRDYQNGRIVIYVNGVLEASATAGTSNLDDNNNILIGTNSDWLGVIPRHYEGSLDDIRIWNVVRNASDIALYKNCELSPQIGLVAYYKCNEGTPNGNNTNIGGQLLDASGNNSIANTINLQRNGNSSNWVSGAVNIGSSCLSPSISISTTNTTVCSGTNVIFTANPANTTTTPTYQWRKNGSNVGSSSTTYTTSSLSNGDVITCVLTSEANTPLSNNLTMNITSAPVGVNIRAIPSNNVCYGNSVTLNASNSTNNDLTFDGQNDYVNLGNITQLDNTTAFTFEALLYSTEIERAKTIFAKRDYDGNRIQLQYEQGVATGNRLVFLINNTWGYSTTETFPLNQWNHVAVVYNGTGSSNQDRLKMYINGVAISLTYQGTIPSTTPIVSQPCLLGSESTSASSMISFTGKMNDVRIWTVPRTATEIASNINACLSGSESGLLANYKCDESTGTTLINSANGGNFNGTLNNFNTATSWNISTVGCNAVYGSPLTFSWSNGLTNNVAFIPTQTTTYTVTATNAEGCSTTQNVTLNVLPSSLPAITGANAVNMGGTITLANNVANGTWESTNPTIATVDANGNVSGIRSGTVEIKYLLNNACGNLSISKTITVQEIAAYCLKFTPRRVGNHVEITVRMAADRAAFRLGSANMQIKYNSTVLGTPTLISDELTNTGNYSGINLTEPAALNLGANEAIVSINCNFTGTMGQGIAIPMNEQGTIIGVIRFSILNDANTPNLKGYVNNDIGSVVYDDKTVNPYLVPVAVGCGEYNVSLSTVVTYGSAAYCASATAQTPILTGTTGGVYAATAGLTIDPLTGVITPSSSTIATHWVTYTIPNAQGGTTAFQVTIHPNPTVNITNLNASYCQNVSAVVLTGTPSGGIFTINGISATSLNPSALSSGSHGVVYTYTDANSCTGTATQNITINSLPIVPVITGAPSVFIGATTTLSNVVSNGTWSSANTNIATIDNSGVVTGVDAGNSIISYAVTNSCGTTTVTHQIEVKINKIIIAMKVLLQGNYNAITGLMNDNLRVNQLIPTNEPYTSTPNFTHRGDGGDETTNTSVLANSGEDAIVDWIFVELRNKNISTQVLHTRAALVQRDGDIVEVDGISPISFTNATPDDYFVAVRHRNHLGFRTLNTVTIGRTVNASVLDLTNGSVALFGRNALIAASNGKFVMYGGNGDSNGAINAIDKNTIWLTQNGVNTYLRGDFNLDGVVNAFDVNSIWLPNNSIVQQLDY